MSTTKRRKLNTEEPAPPMSAFALRKKLAGQKSSLASPPVTDGAGPESPKLVVIDAAKEAASPEKKTRRARTTRNATVERNGPASESVPQVRVASVELPEPSISQADAPSRGSSPFSLEGVEDESNPSVTQPVNFSSLRPSKTNPRKKSNGVFHLKLVDGDRIVVLGLYGIRVESGEVTIYGATFKPSKDIHWVYAPQSHALPVVRCTDDAALELHPHPRAQEIKSIGRLSPLFRKLWWESPSSQGKDKSASCSESFRILYTSEDGPKRVALQDLKSPPDWNREMAVLVTSNNTKPASIMVTGPKSSGKSTFGKILMNRLLTRAPVKKKRKGHEGVAVLDLDPGQPEYCIPGHIALVLVTQPVLSPSFCRPTDAPGIQTVRSHALASLSPASDPSLYIEMATDLMTHYRNTLGSYPLIINTPGWIQGTGLDLLVSLIGELRPSDVLYMSQTGPAEAVESLEAACNLSRFTILPSQPGQGSPRTASNIRSMHTMAYFHAETSSPKEIKGHPSWFQRPLTYMPPWQVRFRGDNRGIFGVLCYDFQTQSDFVADAINGSLLAAVEVENANAFRSFGNNTCRGDVTGGGANSGSPMDLDVDEASQVKSPSLSVVQQAITNLTPEGIPFIDTSHGLTLDPRYSRSLGLVLVRGIDVENGDLHLLGHISTSQVEEVKAKGGQIVLVSGKFDPPSWAYTEDLYFQTEGDEGDVNEEADSNSQGASNAETLEKAQLDADDTLYNGIALVPWIEIFAGNQKRGAGSKVWRVRRDLGRLGNPGD